MRFVYNSTMIYVTLWHTDGFGCPAGIIVVRYGVGYIKNFNGGSEMKKVVSFILIALMCAALACGRIRVGC